MLAGDGTEGGNLNVFTAYSAVTLQPNQPGHETWFNVEVAGIATTELQGVTACGSPPAVAILSNSFNSA
jgi:hypothetical protein